MHYGMCVSMGGGALAPSAPPLDPPLPDQETVQGTGS